MAPAKEEPTVEETFDHIPFEIIIADNTGKVLNLNKTAVQLVGTDDGLVVRREKLRAIVKCENDDLLACIAEVANTPSGQSCAVRCLSISRPDTPHRPYALLISPKRARSNAQKRCVLIFVTDLEENLHVSGTCLIRLFGLSPVEAQTAICVAHGKSPDEISAQRGVKLSTVRSQIHAVYAKMGVEQQSELVRLMCSLPSIK